MENGFRAIKPEQIEESIFKLISKDWMLISAGNADKFNTMTASWGGMGILWEKKVCFCVIRPHRYTYEFVENNDVFSLSFLGDKYRHALNICGTKSGRNTDKVAEAGITPVEGSGTVYFSEAKLVLICKKLYFHNFDPANFLDPAMESFYPQKDYHRMYIGEIVEAGIRD